MQIGSSGNNLHGMPNPVSVKNKKKNIDSLLSVEFVQRVTVVKVLSKIVANNISKKKKKKILLFFSEKN